ncbi:hypothetical protein ACVW1A_008256 [Bradyrhizobium sp. LB1.3]|uniref:hypothetical protein n=1 Tax=unclassified Bradyrhizobium TaxID=2631580 RepID=UPI0033926A97
MNIWTGVAMLAIAAVLIFIGRPNKAGEHPKFLRFEAALVLYPPIILSFIGLGAAALISSLLTR